MRNRSSQGIQNPGPVKSNHPKYSSKEQHGVQSDHCPLLSIPTETLTGITSHLDPFSLLFLSRVNKQLYEHVKDENTWQRAFANQFLGIGPEGDLRNFSKRLLLRRLEPTWRREFVFRYRMARRWALSRNTTITHVPVYSSISSMHFMGNNSLLSSSLQYGIVARSRPLTGRVLRGYLDASGTGNGMGIGNPNAEFSPNVTACTLGSDGGTARIVWGYRNGEVAVLTAPKAMEASTSSADLVWCRPDDQHAGAVMGASWDAGKGFVVTAGADGKVKLWDSKRVRCIWTSEESTESLVPDPCVMVVAALTTTGSVASATRSGKVLLWTGFQLNNSPEDLAPHSIIQFHHSRPSPSPTNDGDLQLSQDVIALHIDTTAVAPTLLVAYRDDPHFYRLVLSANRKSFLCTAFGDPSFGPIASLVPFFRTDTDEFSFVLTGDHLGCLSVYDWDTAYPPADLLPTSSAPTQSTVLPLHKFEAHEDGSSVTSIAWNGVILLTGSARGYTHAWDGLTFEHLRTFSAPSPPLRRRHPAGQEDRNIAVKQILLSEEKDLVLINVGDAVTTWLAGPVPRGGSSGRHRIGHGLGKKKAKGTSKYHEQLELKQSIAESKQVLKEENDQRKKVYGREREHRAGLERLGLDEAGAVEYLLMLSLEEAQERERTQALSNAVERDHSLADEGSFADQSISSHTELFEDDLEDLLYGSEPPLTATAQISSPSPSSPQSSSSASLSLQSVEELTSSSYASYASTHSNRSRRHSLSPIDQLPPLISQVSTASNDSSYVTPRIQSSSRPSAVGFPPISPPTGTAHPTSSGQQGRGIGSSPPTARTPSERGVGPSNLRSQTPTTPPRSQGLSGQSDKSSTSPTPGLPSTSAWARSPKLSVMSASSSGSPSTSPTATSRTGGTRSASGAARSAASPGGAVYHRHQLNSPRGSTYASPSATPARGGGYVSTYTRTAYSGGNEEDDDLRFAIELSLAEARSRGEDV